MYLKGKPLFGIDFGGTKTDVAQVNPDTGRIIGKVTTIPTSKFNTNPALTEAIRRTLPDDPCNVGIGAAGFIDEKAKMLKNSPNAKINGDVTFGSDLATFGFNVEMGNDMPTALMGAVMFGQGRGLSHVALGTFSSGNNYAVAREGRLDHVRMEASHYPGVTFAESYCGWLRSPSAMGIHGTDGKSSALNQLRQYLFIRGTKEADHPLVLAGMENYNTYAKQAKVPKISEPDLASSKLAFSRAVCFIDPKNIGEHTVLGNKHEAVAITGIVTRQKLFCGCGAQGHIEPYISGNGAASMAQSYFAAQPVFSSHPILKHALADYNEDAKKDGLPAYTVEDLRRKDAYTAVVGSIGSKHVYLAYAEDPHGTPQHDIKETQVFMLASSMGILVAHQNPLDMLICIGSMTKDWKILFEPVTALLQRNPGGRFYLPELKPPTIVRNTFENVAIIGAAAYLLAKQNVLEKK